MADSYLERGDLPPEWELADRLLGRSFGTEEAKYSSIKDGTSQCLQGFIMIDEAMRELAGTKRDLYRAKPDGSPKVSPIAEKLVLGAKMAGNHLHWSHEYNEYAPSVQLVRDLYPAAPPPAFMMTRADIDVGNQWVEALRQGMSTSAYREKQRIRKGSVARTLKRVHKYLDDLFEYLSKALICRVDFGYEFERRSFVSLEQTKEDRSALRISLQNKFPAMAGFCIRTEHSPIKRLHHHGVFIFDGHQHREDISLSELIGKTWQEIAIQGTYWNCNKDKERYEKINRLGIGMIHYSDAVKRANLYRAVGYLVKIDSLIRMLPGKTGKAFVKGYSPKLSPHRIGRPRQFQNPDTSSWSNLFLPR